MAGIYGEYEIHGDTNQTAGGKKVYGFIRTESNFGRACVAASEIDGGRVFNDSGVLVWKNEEEK